MTILIASGFLAATAYVETFLAANGVTAKVDVGWRKRTQQINQGAGGANRVIFIPSGDGGDGGTLGPARFPGPRSVRPAADQPAVGSVRSLVNWERQCLVSIWGVDPDPTKRADEEAQIAATERLLEWVVRAVHSAPGAFAAVSFGKVKWTPPAERSFGVELLTSLTFSQPIFDVPRDIVYPTSAAVARGTLPIPAPTDSGHGDT